MLSIAILVWELTWSLGLRLLPIASNSSIKMMAGCFFRAAANKSRIRLAPTPTNISSNSDLKTLRISAEGKSTIHMPRCKEKRLLMNDYRITQSTTINSPHQLLPQQHVQVKSSQFQVDQLRAHPWATCHRGSKTK